MIDFFYMLAASHSGSTLLTLLLSAHPEVASVGETSAVLKVGEGDTGLCSCGESMDRCSFWMRVRQEMNRQNVDWNEPGFQTVFRMSEHRFNDRIVRAEYRGSFLEAVRDVLLALSPSWRSRQRRIMENNVALVEAVTKLTKGSVFLDSSKEPHRLKFLMKAPSFRTKVIHLVRDGRGVTASYKRRHDWPIETCIDEWRRSIVSEEHILRNFRSDQIIRIRYEDLCADVGGSLPKLFAFMGVDSSYRVTDFRSANAHVLGNRMRMQKSNEIRLDEQWRTSLTPGDLERFEKLAGGINARYGYAPIAGADS